MFCVGWLFGGRRFHFRHLVKWLWHCGWPINVFTLSHHVHVISCGTLVWVGSRTACTAIVNAMQCIRTCQFITKTHIHRASTLPIAMSDHSFSHSLPIRVRMERTNSLHWANHRNTIYAIQRPGEMIIKTEHVCCYYWHENWVWPQPHAMPTESVSVVLKRSAGGRQTEGSAMYEIELLAGLLLCHVCVCVWLGHNACHRHNALCVHYAAVYRYFSLPQHGQMILSELLSIRCENSENRCK